MRSAVLSTSWARREVCSQPENAAHAQCPHPNPLVLTGVDDRDFLAVDVTIKSNTGWVSSEGWVDLWITPDSEAKARNGFETWSADDSGRHNFAAARELSAATMTAEALPLPAVTTLEHKRNGVEQLLLQNSGHASTMAVVATIELAEWPAMQGRAVYFAIEAKIQTNLTGLSLAVGIQTTSTTAAAAAAAAAATDPSSPSSSSPSSVSPSSVAAAETDGAAMKWSYSHHMIAYTEQVGAYSMTSFQAVLPTIDADSNSTERVTNATAFFAVSLFGENAEAGKAASAVLGDVVVAAVGASWPSVVEAPAVSYLG